MLKNSHFEDKGRKRPLRVFPFFTHTIKCICLKSAIGVLTTMYTNNHYHCQDFHPFKKSSLTPLPSTTFRSVPSQQLLGLLLPFFFSLTIWKLNFFPSLIEIWLTDKNCVYLGYTISLFKSVQCDDLIDIMIAISS